jgi:hypothetical protein
MDEYDVRVYEIGPDPGATLEGWRFDALGPDDYKSPRAGRLYRALGPPHDPDACSEEVLAECDDGRWALFGLTVTGHPYACEMPRGVR